MERKNSIDQALAEKDRFMDALPIISAYLDMKYKSINVEGIDTIPSGPAMFVANHLRFDDSLIAASVYANYMKRPIRLGAKSEYFEGGGINDKGRLGWPIQKFVELTQQIPVYREDNRKGAISLAKDIKYRFEIGESVLLHAEGTRSPDGRLNSFRKGATAFAIKYGVPIVPVSFSYDDGRFYQRTTVDLEFGRPLNPQDYGMEFKHHRLIPDGLVDALAPRVMKQSERVAAITEIIEQRIAVMSGQERSGLLIDPYNR
ncbi:1-acyl-sn-glycerol-3-phosphate acyltransferase [Candidatus Saccharibacteria bacterium]|nr:1-acyl-sn-glycerol-3-phosphate acyltransferase [Candidatus Saccharibacteria bacterium]